MTRGVGICKFCEKPLEEGQPIVYTGYATWVGSKVLHYRTDWSKWENQDYFHEECWKVAKNSYF